MSLLYIIIVIFLIVFAGLCACIETSVTAASPGKIYNLIDRNDQNALKIKQILKIKNKVISTLLIFNTFLLTIATTIATSIAISIYGEEYGTLIASITLSIAIIILAEVLPKTIGVSNPDKITINTIWLIKILLLILTPINFLLTQLIKSLCYIFKIKLHNPILVTEEISGIIEHHKEENIEKENEDIKILKGAIDITKTNINKIMLHKNKIFSINIDLPTKEIINLAIKSYYSYIPLWKDNNENIIEVLDAKRMFREVNSSSIKNIEIKKYTKEAYFIPENITIIEQLQNFRHTNNKMALIIDEYGKLEGLVTLHDIAEEIIGDLKTENNIEDNIIANEENIFTVKGETLIRDLNKKLDIQLDENTANTIGGYIINYLGRLPKKQDQIVTDKYNIKVLNVRNNIVKYLTITLYDNDQ